MSAPTVRRWQFELRAQHSMQTSNGNKHWSDTSEPQQAWRAAACKAASRLRMPKGLARIRVDVELVFPPAKRGSKQRKRDAPNFYQGIGKRIVDGLGPQRVVRGKSGLRVEPGHGVVPDDTAKQVHGPNITISERLADTSTHPFGYAQVTVWDLSTPPAMPESGDGWTVVSWKDGQGTHWYRWGEGFSDVGDWHGREKAEMFDSRAALEAARGPVTPFMVDRPLALLQELHRTRMELTGFEVERGDQ